MAVGRAINGKREIAMPPAGYVPHPELAASLDYQIEQQSKPAIQEVQQEAVRDETSHTQSTMDQDNEDQTNVRQEHEYNVGYGEGSDSNSVEEEQEEEEVVRPVAVKSNKSVSENMRALREKSERDDREKLEMRMKMLEMESRQQQHYNAPKVQEVKEVEEQFQFDLDEDSLVEGKQLRKMAQDMFEMKKMLKLQKLEIERSKKEAQVVSMDMKIKNQYPDFTQVFSKNNIDVLVAQHSDIVDSLNTIPDEYSRSIAAYRIIKNLGIGNQPTGQGYELDKQKAVFNTAKPRTATSNSPTQGGSPLSRVNGFIDGKMNKEAKEKAWQETQDARRR